MKILCWQAIFMKYHALFVIFENAAKFDIVVCCKLRVKRKVCATAPLDSFVIQNPC